MTGDQLEGAVWRLLKEDPALTVTLAVVFLTMIVGMLFSPEFREGFYAFFGVNWS